MATTPHKTKASQIIESWGKILNESTITTTDIPDFDKVKNTLQTQGNLLPIPHMPYLNTIEYGGHQFTVADASHATAPQGMQDSITSSPAGIEHIKTQMSTLNPDGN